MSQSIAALPKIRHRFNRSSGFYALLLAVLLSIDSAQAAPVQSRARELAGSTASEIEIGRGRRQLFVDDYVIAEMMGVSSMLHHPQPREIALKPELPWEMGAISCMVAFEDEGRYRAWYRSDQPGYFSQRAEDGPRRGSAVSPVTAYAESADGIHWTKPTLGLVLYEGSTANNIVWDGTPPEGEKTPFANMSPFRDDNPKAKPEERYKAVIRKGDGLFGMVSPDGLRWKLLRKEPLLDDPPFDTMSIAFWDREMQHYVIYTRGAQMSGTLGVGMAAKFWKKGGTRAVRRATSLDFHTWSKPELVQIKGDTREELYTSSTTQYDRAPDQLFMLATRFASARSPEPGLPEVYKDSDTGVTDVILLTSRNGGLSWDRKFREAFIRPGLDRKNWIDRGFYMSSGILQTSKEELSFYISEHWWVPSLRIRRYTLRTDGFASIHAPYAGGEFTTKFFRLYGSNLELNFSTSGVGSVQVEVQDAHGTPVPDYRLADCREIYGDAIARMVNWAERTDLGALSGQMVRLRFVMRDADLYSFVIQ